MSGAEMARDWDKLCLHDGFDSVFKIVQGCDNEVCWVYVYDAVENVRAEFGFGLEEEEHLLQFLIGRKQARDASGA